MEWREDESREPAAKPVQAGPIDRISLVGFKSHKETLNVALKPITLLAGGNSSGKSSLMQPLLLEADLENPFEPPPLNLAGQSSPSTTLRTSSGGG
ncbi:MAG: hypothetical protein IPI35_07805 [Deltaproteobacteria bacterium]|nr:hypothetical protein [Deltaproteobacteria bacterium]